MTFSGLAGVSVPTTTTSTTTSTAAVRYTNASGSSRAEQWISPPPGGVSILRADNFATGAPGQAGFPPNFSEPFSFIGHQSLVNTTRATQGILQELPALRL